MAARHVHVHCTEGASDDLCLVISAIPVAPVIRLLLPASYVNYLIPSFGGLRRVTAQAPSVKVKDGACVPQVERERDERIIWYGMHLACPLLYPFTIYTPRLSLIIACCSPRRIDPSARDHTLDATEISQTDLSDSNKLVSLAF